MLATYRRSLVAVVRAQGTDKGLQNGEAGVADLLQSCPIVQVQSTGLRSRGPCHASQSTESLLCTFLLGWISGHPGCADQNTAARPVMRKHSLPARLQQLTAACIVRVCAAGAQCDALLCRGSWKRMTCCETKCAAGEVFLSSSQPRRSDELGDPKAVQAWAMLHSRCISAPAASAHGNRLDQVCLRLLCDGAHPASVLQDSAGGHRSH